MCHRIQMGVCCPTCGNTVLGDTALNLVNENVVLLDFFQMETFWCEECGTRVFTGDVTCMYEYEEEEPDYE